MNRITRCVAFRLSSAVSPFLFVSLALLVFAALAWSAAGAALADGTNAGKDDLVAYLGTRSEARMGFDPLFGFANVDGVSIFHSNLIRLNSDMTIENEFAEDWSVLNDGLTYRFLLRDDVKCSDGELLTAGDVAFTFSKAKESGYVGGLEDIREIEAVSDREILIHLNQPNSLFIYTVCRLPIVPERAYKEDYGRSPVGSGPYQMVAWDKGQQMIVERNPHYFRGVPKLRRITFLFLAEEAAFEAVKSGQIDLYEVPYTYARLDVPGTRLVTFDTVGKFCASLPTTPSGDVNEHGMKIGNDVTSSRSVRQAMNYGVNRAQMVKGLMYGYGSPAYGLIDKQMPYYNPETDYEDDDVEKAKAILAADGWTDSDGDGIVEKDGLKAEFPLLVNAKDKLLQSFGMLICEQLKRVGLNAVLEVKSWEEVDSRRHSDVWLLNWGSIEPINVYYLYYGPNKGKGFYNSGYYVNPVVDGHIERALAATDEAEMNERWKKAQWDGETGFSVRGDAVWLMLVNKQFLYRLKEGLNIGERGFLNGTMGWIIARNIHEWRWE
ncbi:MAG: ABC transporter substrate-binding protein [Deltaproteobacteria bacterium]|jgi:peptide/nickel transport system substrate-binding protein|nr:ABC transporter substrate-binding protein [Deltaproteobacteria bacterium]